MSTRTLLSRLFTVTVCLTVAGCAVAPVSESGQPAVAHRTVPATARKTPVDTSVPGAGSTAGTTGSSQKGGVLGGFRPPSVGANPELPGDKGDDTLALSHDEEGALVVSKEAQRFNETYADCDHSANKPVFLCSGILFRATAYSPNYHSWVPNPSSPKAGGVSFAYLRKNVTFSAFETYTNGFITYAPLSTPPSLYQLEILCAFPTDGGTDVRSDRGCGYAKKYPQDSVPCQSQGITTSDQWLAHFWAAGAPDGYLRYQRSCGFTLAIGTANSAPVFMEVLAAHKVVRDQQPRAWNEIIVKSWADRPNAIGIESFFYFSGTAGLSDAQNSQRDFYTTVGVWRPLIRMTLPAQNGGDVTFAYIPGEQGVR
jgi:hypothetical protein